MKVYLICLVVVLGAVGWVVKWSPAARAMKERNERIERILEEIDGRGNPKAQDQVMKREI